MNIIKLKINVKKIDKARLFKADSGAVYLDCTLLPTPDSKYDSTHMIVQDVSKEERDKGIKGNILGNAKELIKEPEVGKTNGKVETPEVIEPEDDLPF